MNKWKIDEFYSKKAIEWNNLSTPEFVTESLKALEKEEKLA